MKTHRTSVLSKAILRWLLMVSGFLLVHRESSAADVYVSVDGHIQADGSIEKPFGSIPDAVSAVRALRAAGNSDPAVIYLREGRHQLDETLVVGLRDGHTTATTVPLEKHGAGQETRPAHLTFAAYPGEQPVVSGGVPITGWKRLEPTPPELPAKAAGKVWVADMPADLGRFHCLFDDRGRLSRARDAGFAVTKPGDQRTLNFPKGALKPWDNMEDVEIQVRPFRPWVINMLPLASVDEASGVAKTGVSATYAMSALPGWVHNPSGSNVWVENVLEALDEPGEWVVNTKTRKVYLWPSDSATDGSPRGILAPSTSELIRVEGTIDYDGPMDTPVRGIAFSGLNFTHADRLAWTSDETRLGWGMQHDWDMFDKPTATLRFRGAEECSVTACRFLDSGGSGLRMDLHAQRNRVEDCEFAHLGEAGILLAGYGPGTKDVNHHNDIFNNSIHHFSEITWHSPGFWAWQSGHNRISHNEMHHSGYAAVLITTRVNPYKNRGGLTGEGAKTIRRAEIAPEENESRTGYESWQNRERYIHSRHNLLEYNEISHAVQLLSDGNGIYVSGAGTGNIVRYNYLHDNQAHSLPAAIRCDDDQHDTLIYGNVLYKNHGFSAGIASKGVNDILNNFIVAPVAVPRWGYLSFEWVPVTGSKVQRNIIISHPDGGNAHAARPRGGGRTSSGSGGPKLEQTDMDSNLYFHPTNSHWMDEHLSKMRAIGKEKSSLFGDPLFTDAAGGDFSFRPGSPALKLGIEPLDVSKMGRKGKDRGAGNSAAVRRPDFSWDHVPLYMHVRKASDFTPEELEYLAGFPLITLEKTTGSKTHGSSEAGSRAAARAIKAVNQDACVLYYRNVLCNYSTYKVNKKLKAIRGAFLQGSDGNRRLHRGVREVYDLSNPEVRKWWVDHCVEMAGYDEIDGLFLDGNIKALEPAYLRKEIGDEKKHAVAEGYAVMMQDLKNRMPPNKMLVANIIRARLTDSGLGYLQYFDGSYLEGIESQANGLTRVEYLAKGIDAVQTAARQGKMICMSIGLGNSALTGLKIDDSRKKLARGADIQPRLEYCLALFLICAEKHSYFLPHDGYDVNDNRSSVWLTRFPEYDKPLGPPKGPAIQDGYAYTREFESASVFLDIEKREAKITWK